VGQLAYALRADGTVVSWSPSTGARLDAPGNWNNIRAISAGANHLLAVKNDGTVTSWGTDHSGQPVSIPSGLSNVISVAAGPYHNLALRSDGLVVAWGPGAHTHRAADIPISLTNVIAIAAGYGHSFALIRHGPQMESFRFETVNFQEESRFSLEVSGPAGAPYVLEQTEALPSWRPLARKTVRPGIPLVIENEPANLSRSFFRLRRP